MERHWLPTALQFLLAINDDAPAWCILEKKMELVVFYASIKKLQRNHQEYAALIDHEITVGFQTSKFQE